MFEKTNPAHPDKIADRIAGAVVDLAYKKEKDPKIAVEVLIGHGRCHVITEGTIVSRGDIEKAIWRITGTPEIAIDIVQVRQDKHLAENQAHGMRCGDNGIFKGLPVTEEEDVLTQLAEEIYSKYPYDGKYVICHDDVVICQSNADTAELIATYPDAKINPLGDWTGGPDVDTGCTNRKLGSDMGGSVTGSGLHGKDCSKADVSANIFCFLKAQETGKPVQAYCAIGDEYITIDNGDSLSSIPFEWIVREAKEYIKSIGGFEKLAEWGLIR